MKQKINEKLKKLGYAIEDKLKSLCGEITPDKRITVILIMLLLFTVGSLYFSISSIYNWGKESERRKQMQIEHIRSLELERQQKREREFIDSEIEESLFDQYRQEREQDSLEQENLRNNNLKSMGKQINLTSEQKQKLKKYAVFALMIIIFAGSMWWIFAPSEADKAKEKERQGFNADIPEPDGGGLIANKKDAYEQEQMQEKQKERMKSLEGYIGILEGEKNGEQVSLAMIDEEPQPISAKIPEQKAPISSSVSAYRDINRTLGNFYEQPREDPEKEEMKKRLEELEARLNDENDKQSAMDEQLALMEKSYELAARYIPKGDNQASADGSELGNRIADGNVKSSNNKGKTNVSPIRRIQNQTVSSLAQNISNEELFYMFAQERNAGFNTVGGEMGVSTKNTIAAVIHDDQTIIDGQTTRLRLTEPLMAGTTMIPDNTILTGVAKIQGERLDVLISSVEYKGTIIPVEMNIYDSDGQRGIYIPGSLELNAAKEIMANMGNSVGTSFTMTQSAGAQLSSDLSKGAIQGMSAYMQKKIRQIKVHLKSGYRVMLMPKAN